MNQTLENWIIISSVVLVFGGATAGAYFGLYKPAPAISEETKTAIATRFASDNVDSIETLDFSSLSGQDRERVKDGNKVLLEDESITAYYFRLYSYDGDYPSLEFSIGVKDGVVSYYHFIDGLSADELGARQAKDNEGKLFIGYSLIGEDVKAGRTREYTYRDRKMAVDSALTFIKGR